MKTYKASFDTTTKVITFIVFLLPFFGILMGILQGVWYMCLTAIVPSICIIATYMYSVKSYQITDEYLIIKRPFSVFDKKIVISEIESASITDQADFNWTIRTFGDGGLFGYYGYFANKKLGSFRMYVTNKANRILIVLKDNKGKIVLSPDDAGMVYHIQKPA